MKSIYTFTLAILISAFSLRASVIQVPDDYPTIQEAINASMSGDTIVVSPDTYFENINFRGKNLVLTSLYYLDADTSYITSTVINGSSPADPDTASCVIFSSGEDSTAVLQGFTITGGSGTKWTDIHGAGVYREGGGILIELSSPRIVHNVITNNACTDLTGVTSTGGGGIRIGDGTPVILGNRISFNEARYGAGIVLNYTGCRIVNNVISSNTGGQNYYGGSGIWIYGNLPGHSKYIINNTIVDNASTLPVGTGGNSVWSATNVFIKNNIIYANVPAAQIKAIDASPVVSYSDVQGGYTGLHNINEDPLFEPVAYFLGDGSPCIDAGDTSSIFNDREDPLNPGYALFPSRGGLRNDMGAYGGQLASVLPFFQSITGVDEEKRHGGKEAWGHGNLDVYPNPSNGVIYLSGSMGASGQGGMGAWGHGSVEVWIYNVYGEMVYSAFLPADKNVLDLGSLPDGIYIARLKDGEKNLVGKVIIRKMN